ncbi:hypothetical protein HZA43_03725 [Candidatus Peregrinibacteria bacterium]|nr:hypothetical protein [Candidatus Peregrinibacteria bacterium]
MTKHSLRFLPLILILLIVPLLAACRAGQSTSLPASSTDFFAQCLKDKGAVFYEAFWCGHCKNQKKLFGDSAQFLSYVECATPDGQNQTQECLDQEIKGYPTWEFADGSRQSGEMSFDELSKKTGCVLSSQQKL